jgi:hypothetical protein
MNVMGTDGMSMRALFKFGMDLANNKEGIEFIE